MSVQQNKLWVNGVRSQSLLEFAKAARRFMKPLLILTGLFCLLGSGLALAASDELSDLSATMSANFGAGSTFMHLLYGLEVVSAGYSYFRTKNIAILGGVVILALFTNFALGHWAFPNETPTTDNSDSDDGGDADS